MLDLLLKKGAFSPQNFYKPPAISRTLAAPGGGVTYVSVCRRLYTLVPAIPLVLDALSMEVVLVSTSSGISARRQRGLGPRARTRCLAQRAGELAAHMGWRMRAAVGHAFARSMIALQCPAPPRV